MNAFVTTIKDYNDEIVTAAKTAAANLRIPYVRRKDIRLEKLVNDGAAAIVYEKRATALHTTAGVLRFHLNMAALRIISLKRGETDNMLDAMQLVSGDSVLDCTLGLGSDAVLAAYALGNGAAVTALEKSVLLEHVIANGLRNYECGDSYLDSLIRNIITIRADYREYLEKCPAKCYDLIYFDPMFQYPQKRSSSMIPLRHVASMDQLDKQALANAVRAARKRVVVKLEKFSGEDHYYDAVKGGKYSAVRYGIIYADK